ncbi:hypothetical protein [Caldibacillus debilis]|uniref:hypothetical protein n=1 Tax=Caldibacillus debilis TaxID=301148 RepID=UPI00077927D0|nr:hypothetical protein [Caldibacillus debilis]
MDLYKSRKSFFVKKVVFSSNGMVTELYSLNKLNSEFDGKTIDCTVEVIYSTLNELRKKEGISENKEIKRVISEEEAKELIKMASDEKTFIEKVNELLRESS